MLLVNIAVFLGSVFFPHEVMFFRTIDEALRKYSAIKNSSGTFPC
ncbi:hypothetical protein CHCC20488_1492 [Bacillus paralicheniformis]|nr:hypothetical protein SC10_B2orf01585 [Bacillus paralicheniformis]TWJ58290.1 hypothetical protein CHCC5021_4501 [Bacillus paralicheniformis]TWJ73129.1 hypothetical protein CHCC20497_1338 [Bacillus paralicheniformis]TWK45143.1 hypothetical protein CHCC20347_1349 [Bacillus paralicheniformis]TWN41639.1 hypothetical protein CHCC14523_0693 [Bacillus paralicheniformis]